MFLTLKMRVKGEKVLDIEPLDELSNESKETLKREIKDIEMVVNLHREGWRTIAVISAQENSSFNKEIWLTKEKAPEGESGDHVY